MKNVNDYRWLKFAILNGIEEIKKHYKALPKDAPVRIVNVCANLTITGKKINDPDVKDLERLCLKI